MARAGRSEAEIAALVACYESSGLTRREYCEREGLALTTLDYYRRKRAKRRCGPQKFFPSRKGQAW